MRNCTQFVRMCHPRRRTRWWDRQAEILVEAINRQLAELRERELARAESVR